MEPRIRIVTLGVSDPTRSYEFDRVLERAQGAGARIEKPAQIASWGGCGGDFSDPDGDLWEVARAEDRHFRDDGSLMIT